MREKVWFKLLEIYFLVSALFKNGPKSHISHFGAGSTGILYFSPNIEFSSLETSKRFVL